MYEDALPRLVAAHPTLFRGERPQGSSLPVGWFELADRLCKDLEVMLAQDAGRLSVRQSKEKFGSWRFYWRLEGRQKNLDLDLQLAGGPGDADTLAKGLDGSGTLMALTPVGVRLTAVDPDALSRSIHERVRQAEVESGSTCMFCGAPGELWTNGWLHTVCDAHKEAEAMKLDEWRRRSEQRARASRRNRKKR